MVKVELAAGEGGAAERGPETLQENGSASRLLPWFSEFSTLFAGGSLSVWRGALSVTRGLSILT